MWQAKEDMNRLKASIDSEYQIYPELRVPPASQDILNDIRMILK